MKSYYFECNSGISGDMTVAALLDLGADPDVLMKALESLHVDGFHIHISKVKKRGIEATDFDVHLADEGHEHHHHDDACGHSHEHPHVHAHSCDSDHPHAHSHEHSHESGHEHSHEEDCAHKHGEEHSHTHGDHHHPHTHRNLHDIVHIIQDSGITEHAKELAVKIFKVVAEAESKAHGLPIDEVHFHEVGAVDSIVDIVGTAVCLDNLGVERVYCTSISEGQGTVRCQHGIMPVPVPAVTNIAAAHGLTLRITDNNGEMVTPTGAAIVAGIRTDSRLPASFRIVKTGIGAGKKDFEQANILRIHEIETDTSLEEGDEVVVMNTNIDDQTSEQLAYAMEKLFESGARDVWFEPVFMKKNRPALKLNVLCLPHQVETLSEVIFRETSSIGLRYQNYRRIVMDRTLDEVQTEYGPVQIKRCSFHGIRKNTVEYESAKRVAKQHGVPLEEVYRATYKVIK
ncbi:MAG: nickel pincer cofactor biosynthesis protein LarC [Oscillospiraceae bacterium]